MRGTVALVLLAAIFAVGFYGVTTMAHVEVALGLLDFPIGPFALYKSTEVSYYYPAFLVVIILEAFMFFPS